MANKADDMVQIRPNDPYLKLGQMSWNFMGMSYDCLSALRSTRWDIYPQN